MGLLNRRNANNVLYLTPVQIGDEQLDEDKIRILCCDAKGNIGSVVIEASSYEVARSRVEELERDHKNCAVLGIETTPGNSTPFAFEISWGQVYAMERILEHALKTGKIPNILKDYAKDIIGLGSKRSKNSVNQHKRADHQAPVGVASEVLNTEYPQDVEGAIPIYKAAYYYPLVVLKRLAPNAQTPPDMQRLLILDSEGDLAVIRVPLERIDKAEIAFKRWKKANKADGYLICSQHSNDLVINHMETSEFQSKALNVITRHFEETGHAKKPVSRDVQAVLAKARAIITSMGR